MNTLRERVIFRMEKLGLNPSSLARILRERYGLKRTKQSTIQSLTSGRTSTFRKMNELAGALMTTVEWLSTGNGNESFEILEKEFDLPVKVVDRNNQSATDTVPVLDYSNISPGSLMLNFDEVVNYVARLPKQAHMKRVHAFKNRDERALPRYELGEWVYINLEMKPLPMKDCLVVLLNETVDLIKYISQTKKEYCFKRFDTGKEYKVAILDVKVLHAVVGRG